MSAPQCPICKGPNVEMKIDAELLARMRCADCGFQSDKFRVYPDNDSAKQRVDPMGLLKQTGIHSQAADTPAELWPVGHFIEDELHNRLWSRNELAERIGGNMSVNQLVIDLLIDAPTKGVTLGKDLAEDLARVFGTSTEFWLNIDAAWQNNVSAESH